MKGFTLFILLVACFFPNAYSQNNHPDKYIDTKTFKGKFVSTSHADRSWLNFHDSNGNRESFFFSDIHEFCFLDAMKNETISVTYDVIEKYFWEGGGYYPVKIIKSMKSETSDYASWLNSEDKPSREKCESKLKESMNDPARLE